MTAGRTISAAARTILVIRNPGAGAHLPIGGGDGPGRDEIESLLGRHGLAADVFDSPSEEATAARVDQAVRDGAELVVAAGGDGTVESVAFDLVDSGVALGILPLGSAMNIARSLGIPRDLEAAGAILAAGHVRAIDVGEVRSPRSQRFLGVVSVGLGADVLAQGDHLDEGRYGRFIAMLGRAVRHEAVRLEIDLDGRTIRTRAVGLAVANGPFTGIGIGVAPAARLDDGQLDVVVFEGFSKVGLVVHLARRLGGRRVPARGIRTHRASKVAVRPRHPLSVRADSRDLGTTPVEVVLHPGALRVVAPGASHGAGEVEAVRARTSNQKEVVL